VPVCALLAASTGCSLWDASEEEPPAAADQAPSDSPTEEPEPERGGLDSGDPEAAESIEFVGMDTESGPTVLLYTADFTNAGTYEPVPTPEQGTARAELDVTSVVARDGSVELTVDAAYLHDAGELTVHADDFLGQVLPGGYASLSAEEYAPEEAGVLAVVGPREPSAEFTLTFQGLPELSLFRYELLAENIRGYDAQTYPGSIAAITCLEVDGADGRVWSQDGDTPCDLAWS
jgi:hypothetical protein